MKISVNSLLGAVSALNFIAEQAVSVSEGLQIARLIKTVTPEVETAEAMRIKLLEQYGKRSEDGASYTIQEDKRAEFAGKLSELMSTEIEIAGEQVTIKSDIKITAKDILAVEKLIVFGDDE